ncbi:MAG: multiheme c-type cytochrome [Acidobacteriota bacterium]
MSRKKILQICVALGLLISGVTLQSFSARQPQQMTVPGWLPNQATEAKYVGTQVCAECHSAKAKTQPHTHMGKALTFAENNEVFRINKNLTFRNGKYSYQIAREGNQINYSVSDGTNTVSVPVRYCFGNGEAGQTYVLQYKNRFYESRLSFYNDIRGLDFTMGHLPTPPATLDEAVGREMSSEETRNCFGCHTTGAVNGAKFQLDNFIEGVACESCHGPGEKHVAAVSSGAEGQKLIFNPDRLDTEGMSNFCGACHRSWEQVVLMGLRGVLNVRFQPYRLTNSKCYDTEDKRISCTACHDPHEGRKHDIAYYDARCTACHNPKNKSVKAGFAQETKRLAVACPVGKNKCSSCHMPKIELPGSHFKFTDHQIRVVKEGEPYPN